MKSGKIDILFGTHKILNEKIDFKDLGLLIIDEEQRFGVVHKEQMGFNMAVCGCVLFSPTFDFVVQFFFGKEIEKLFPVRFSTYDLFFVFNRLPNSPDV